MTALKFQIEGWACPTRDANCLFSVICRAFELLAEDYSSRWDSTKAVLVSKQNVKVWDTWLVDNNNRMWRFQLSFFSNQVRNHC